MTPQTIDWTGGQGEPLAQGQQWTIKQGGLLEH